MDGRTEMRTDRRSPDGRPTSTRRPKDERSTIKRNISFMNHKLYHLENHLCNLYKGGVAGSDTPKIQALPRLG